MGIIDQIRTKFKSFNQSRFADELFLFCIILLVALGSFGLGRMSMDEGAAQGDLKITYNPQQGAEEWGEYSENLPNESNYVASKNGTKYYPINCSGANRIKEENRIYFRTVDDAESVGYARTSTCGSF